MKKLFLTSGVILCMAFPAMADIASGTSSASCTETVLGATSGTVDFESQWRPAISGQITLDSNRYTSNNGSAVGTVATYAAPTPVYSVYDVGVYSGTAPTAATLENFTTANRMTQLTNTPAMTGYNFAGFYTTKATGGTQVIDATGQVIYPAASQQVTTDNGNPSWYARWTPKNYTITYNAGLHGSGSAVQYTGSSNGGLTYNSTWTSKTFAQTGFTAASGYTFSKWNTAADGSGTNYNPGVSQGTWTTDDGLTLYAIYTLSRRTITYSCGTKPSGASTNVTGSGPSNGAATPGLQYTLSPSYGSCELPGYHATGWDCTGGVTLTNASGQQAALGNNVQSDIACTVHWVANSISLNYYEDSEATTTFTTGSCNYDSTFTLPTNVPTKNGYHIVGYNIRVPACNLSDLNINEPSTYGYIADPNGNNWDGLSSNADTYGLTQANTWGVSFSNGTATGQALCSVTNGNTHGATGNPSSTSGDYCWCRATGYTVNGGSQCEISSSSWVFDEKYDWEPDGDCLGRCAMRCAFKVRMQTGIETPLFSGQ